MTRQSGSMNRYSKRTVHPVTSPWPSTGVVGTCWTAMVPDEPYRAKGLCREGNFPLTPCTFIVVPPLLITLSESTLAFKFGAIFAKSTSLAYSSLASSASVAAAHRFCSITRFYPGVFGTTRPLLTLPPPNHLTYTLTRSFKNSVFSLDYFSCPTAPDPRLVLPQ